MTFKIINPIFRIASDKSLKTVRVAFRSHDQCLVITLGKQIASKIGLKSNDKINLFYNDKKPNIWMLKKATSNNGYKVLEASKTALKCQIVLKPQKLKLKSKNNLSKIVKHRVFNDYILIFSEQPLCKLND